MEKSHIGLYYPYMHFRDENWLKAAALYWDQINRIVPDEMKGHTDDSATVERLKGELDLIHEINPTWEAEQIAVPFCQALIRSEDQLRKKYSVANKDSWKSDYTALRKSQSQPLPKKFDTRLAYVQTGKMDKTIRDYLVDEKLAILLDNFEFDKQWLGMHPDIADAYMTGLARTMGSNGQMHPLTDRSRNQAAIAELTIDDIVALYLLDSEEDGKVTEVESLSSDDLRNTYVQMAFKVVLPKDLSQVSVEKIIALRKGEYTTAFRAFQSKISDVVSEERTKRMDAIKNQDSRRAHVENDFTREIKEPFEELEKKMEDLVGKGNTVSTVLNVVVQLVQASAKGMLAMGSKAIGLSEKFEAQHQKRKDRLLHSPEGYLLHIKEELEPASSMRKVVRRWRKFLSGV